MRLLIVIAILNTVAVFGGELDGAARNTVYLFEEALAASKDGEAAKLCETFFLSPDEEAKKKNIQSIEALQGWVWGIKSIASIDPVAGSNGSRVEVLVESSSKKVEMVGWQVAFVVEAKPGDKKGTLVSAKTRGSFTFRSYKRANDAVNEVLKDAFEGLGEHEKQKKLKGQ